MLSEYEIYHKKVVNLTRINKKKVFENWNGYDYYDGQYIKNNFNLNTSDKNYPTIDHKTSVYYGFLNNISVEYICSEENLCITKRSINSTKRHLNESEYYEYLKSI